MELLNSLRLRLAAISRRRRLDQDLEDELAFHMAMRAERLKEAGNDGGEARVAAQRSFGNPTLVRETLRENWSFPAVESFWQDIRHGARALRRAPAFTTVAVLSLAIGIGANTAVFSALYAVYLRSLPVADPQHLRVVTWHAAGNTPVRSSSGYGTSVNGVNVSGSFSWQAFQELQAVSTFESLAGWANHQTNISSRGDAFVAQGQFITSNYFETLRARLAAGRGFHSAENAAGGPSVAVLSARSAKRLFGSEGSAVGATVYIERMPFTIVGVTGHDFGSVSPGLVTDVYLPIARAQQHSKWYTFEPHNWWVQAIGRLKPGLDDIQAKAAVDVALARIMQANASKGDGKPGKMQAILVNGRSGLSFLGQDRAEFLYALLGMAALVLLIACANVANLLLARGVARTREIAVRQSIGAGRGRVIRHLTIESALLGAGGGLLGLVFAFAGTEFLKLALFSSPDTVVDLSPDRAVLAFTFALSVLSALVFGLLPAVRTSDVAPAAALRHTGASAGAPRQFAAKVLIGVQVMAATVLVTGAGLLGQTLLNLGKVDLGFRKEGILLFQVDASRNGYKDGRLIDVYRRLEQKFAAIPAARQVSHSNQVLIGGSRTNSTFNIVNGPVRDSSGKEPVANIHVAGTGFLTMMGTPVLMGRDIAAADTENAPRIAVVNRALAARYFDGNPVGREFSFSGPSEAPRKTYRIVGVAADAKYEGVRQEISPTIYVPYAQAPDLGRRYFAIRAAGDPLHLIPEVRKVLTGVDPTLPASDFRTQAAQVDRALARERTFAALASFFSVVSLVLACIGIYGVFAYTVTRRTPEFGIRMALGATGAQVRWLVLRGSFTVLTLGVAAGVPAAIACSKFVRSLLFGVEAVNPATLALAVLALMSAGLFAAWLPARRAALADPAAALKTE